MKNQKKEIKPSERMYAKPFVVMSCWHCRGIQIADMRCKTHRCPYCGTTLTLRRKRVHPSKFVLVAYKTVREAREALNCIKMKARSVRLAIVKRTV
jgi:ribosomal protein S27E